MGLSWVTLSQHHIENSVAHACIELHNHRTMLGAAWKPAYTP